MKRRRGRSEGSKIKRRIVFNSENIVREEIVNKERGTCDRVNVQKYVMAEIL